MQRFRQAWRKEKCTSCSSGQRAREVFLPDSKMQIMARSIISYKTCRFQTHGTCITWVQWTQTVLRHSTKTQRCSSPQNPKKRSSLITSDSQKQKNTLHASKILGSLQRFVTNLQTVRPLRNIIWDVKRIQIVKVLREAIISSQIFVPKT